MAFASSVVWEVRTTGSDSNGGGFDPTSGVPGTDFSQQTAAQIAYTDMVIGATTTQFTSVANPPAASLVGNVINITSGTGFTVQRVQVLSVAAGVATCDKSLGTTASTGGTGNMGGCLATIGAVAALVVPGNTAWVKATGTYSISASIALSTAGTSGLPISLLGYTTTRGDAGQPTVQTSANTVTNFNEGGNLWVIKNFILDSNNKTTSTAMTVSGTSCLVENVQAKNFTVNGISVTGIGVNTKISNCYATGGGSANTGAFRTLNSTTTFENCIASGNANSGFTTNQGGVLFDRCISANNTGASTDGFQWTVLAPTLHGCIAYANGRDGARGTGATGGDGLSVRNCIFVNNSGFGLNSATTNWANQLADINYNAYYNNTSGARNQVPTGANDVTLTSDPFVAGGTNNFALTTTAGGGGACRAAGFPGALQVGGTGFIDIGALQHQDSGGSAGMLFIPNMEGT